MIQESIVADQRELDAYLRADFLAFVEKAFYELNPGKRFEPCWYLQAMAYHVRVVAIERQVNRLIINLPPRMLKSTMVSVALPAYLLGLDPRRRIAVACYSQELSNKFGRETRAIMATDWYRRIFPSTRLDRHRTAEHDFQTTRKGYRLAVSTLGAFTGRGGDILIVDDPIKADDAHSDVRRTSAVEWTKSTLFSRLDDKRDGVIVLAQQRLHDDDLSGHMLRAGGWLPLVLPAIADEDGWVQTGYGRDRYRRRAGEPLDPRREDLGTLGQIQRDVGSAVFSAQYQQQPTPADGDIIKVAWFRRYEELPPGGECILSVDTAYKATEYSDYSVCTVWRVIDDRYYLDHVWRRKVDYPTLKRMIAELASLFRPSEVVIEDKASGQSLIQDLKAETDTFSVISYMPTTDKVTRMRTQVAKVETGRVYLPREAVWLTDFEIEVRQFPGGKHDDQIDAMAQFLDHMGGRSRKSFWMTTYRV